MIRARFAFCLILALVAALAPGAAPRPAAAAGGSVTVFAAASLTEAFNDLKPAFEKASGLTVTFSFAGSDTLATQIGQGAPADVFASANQAQMTKVATAGLVDGAARIFARNRLVLVVPKANPGHVTALADLAKPGLRVVLADPTVPVGAYARTAFKNLAGTGAYPADFPAAVDRDTVSNELDVKAVLTKIALGEGDAGVVYSTDVTPAVAPKVTVIPFPAGAVPDAVYPIAALKSAPNAAGAQAFVTFVLGDGQTYLRARGFLAP